MKIALILALALATPAKDDTPAQDDLLYIALTTRQCGKTRGVIWIRTDGKDFYVTGASSSTTAPPESSPATASPASMSSLPA